VDGKNCILTDDMVDTGGTLANAVVALKEHGAKAVYAAATHALLSGLASERLSSVPLEEMVVTNTIHVPHERRFDQLTVLSVAELLANAIEFIHSNESVSQLFEISEERSQPGGEAPAAD
jgi:ribose-phosphate pyrophosphokinase